MATSPTGAALANTIGAELDLHYAGPTQVFVGESTFPGRLFKVSRAPVGVPA